MTRYIYKAKKGTAETVNGQITATSVDEAIELINQLGLVPITVLPQEIDIQHTNVQRKVKVKELYNFSRQLANLLKSGVSILRALSIIEEETQNKYFKKLIYQISWNVKNGRSLSDCLAEYPQVFSSLYVTMVHAGEESGNLQEMLVNLAKYQKQEAEIISKVKTALVYPLFMLSVGVITIYFIITFVLPKMSGLFQNLGDKLPIPTIILLNISRLLHAGGLWTIVGILLAIIIIKKWLQSPGGRLFLSAILLKSPIFGDIVTKAEIARFCQTFTLLLKSGVPVIKALSIAVPSLDNEIIKKQLTKCKDELILGGSLGESLKGAANIPPIIAHMIAIGEESGNLQEVLDEIVENLEGEINEQIKVITTLIEPLLILIVGLVIGFIVFAMLLPIFQMDILAT